MATTVFYISLFEKIKIYHLLVGLYLLILMTFITSSFFLFALQMARYNDCYIMSYRSSIKGNLMCISYSVLTNIYSVIFPENSYIALNIYSYFTNLQKEKDNLYIIAALCLDHYE